MNDHSRDPQASAIDGGRRRLLRATGAGAWLAGLLGAGWRPARAATARQDDIVGSTVSAATVAAQPQRIPAPIHRDHALLHHIELVAREVEAEIAPGARFVFMTYDGQVPGPMIRVRQGDSVVLTLTSAAGNQRPHNVDLHAVYGTGGGSRYTTVGPGQSREMRFKCMYPGAFIYHCAVPNLDEHISRGMFGMIVVEPREGLAPVDREFYLGQHEVYTRQPPGSTGRLSFDYAAMAREDPSLVLFNGAAHGFTAGRLGVMEATRGETARVFMVCGGPNLTSNFHPIGNVWTRCWPQGALANAPLHYIQTQPVAPGSCFVGEMDLPVPETIKLVDHALTRVARKGLLAEIEVHGAPVPSISRG